MKNNPALGSLIMGIIMNIVNLVMTCVMFTTGYILYGPLFIAVPVAGIISAVQGIKAGQGVFAIIALILNILAVLGGLVLTVIAFWAKATS